MSNSTFSCPICSRNFTNSTLLEIHVEECLDILDSNDYLTEDMKMAEKLQMEEISKSETNALEWKFQPNQDDGHLYGAASQFNFSKEKEFIKQFEHKSPDEDIFGFTQHSSETSVSNSTLRDMKVNSQMSEGSGSTDFSLMDHAELEIENSETGEIHLNSIARSNFTLEETSRADSPDENLQLGKSRENNCHQSSDEASYSDSDDEEKDLYAGNYDDDDQNDPVKVEKTPLSKELSLSQELPSAISSMCSDNHDLKPAEKARASRNYENLCGTNKPSSLFDDQEIKDLLNSDQPPPVSSCSGDTTKSIDSLTSGVPDDPVTITISYSDKYSGSDFPITHPRSFDEFLEFQQLMNPNLGITNPIQLFDQWKKWQSVKNDSAIYKLPPQAEVKKDETASNTTANTFEHKAINTDPLPEEKKEKKDEVSASTSVKKLSARDIQIVNTSEHKTINTDPPPEEKKEKKVEVSASTSVKKLSARDILQRKRQNKSTHSPQIASNQDQKKDKPVAETNSFTKLPTKDVQAIQLSNSTPERKPTNEVSMNFEEVVSEAPSTGPKKGMSVNEWRKSRRALSTNYIVKENTETTGSLPITIQPDRGQDVSNEKYDEIKSQPIQKGNDLINKCSNNNNVVEPAGSTSLVSNGPGQICPKKSSVTASNPGSSRGSSPERHKSLCEDIPATSSARNQNNFNFKSFSRPRPRTEPGDELLSSKPSSRPTRPQFESNYGKSNGQRNPYSERLHNRLAEFQEWKLGNAKLIEKIQSSSTEAEPVGQPNDIKGADAGIWNSEPCPGQSHNPSQSPQSSRTPEEQDLHIKRRLYRNQRGSARDQMEEFVKNEYDSGFITKEQYNRKKKELEDAIEKGVCPMWTVTTGAVSIYRKLHQDNYIDSKFPVRFSAEADHFASCLGDKGFGCGYRTFQMLLSSFQWKNEFRKKVFQDRTEIPSIWKIQRCLEKAWAQGFDGVDRHEINGSMLDSRHWIGAVDIAAMLSLLGVRCCLIQFGVGPNTTQKELQMSMYTWFEEYFSKSPNCSNFPVYLQYQGHCNLVIGFQKNSSPDISTLIVMDSGLNQWKIRDWAKGKISRNDVTRNVIRFNSINYKQYQLIEVCGLIENPEEMQRAKDLQNITRTLC